MCGHCTRACNALRSILALVTHFCVSLLGASVPASPLSISYVNSTLHWWPLWLSHCGLSQWTASLLLGFPSTLGLAPFCGCPHHWPGPLAFSPAFIFGCLLRSISTPSAILGLSASATQSRPGSAPSCPGLGDPPQRLSDFSQFEADVGVLSSMSGAPSTALFCVWGAPLVCF